MFRGLAEPNHSLRVVWVGAFDIQQADIVLRICAALVGGLTIPAQGLRVVLRNAFTFEVHRPDANVRHYVAPIGGLTKPIESRNIIVSLIRIYASAGHLVRR